MEIVITIGKILGFIIIWIAGVYLWGSIRSGVFGWKSYERKRYKKNRYK